MAPVQAFNLVDEPWVPIAEKGMLSLNEVFSREDVGELGGNPIQKIALFKLFLAIAQAARTPDDNAAWAALKPEGLSKACLAYLEKWHGAFWLYGEAPFLQMPAIARAEKVSFGTLLPHIATGNKTILFNSQYEQTMSDAEKALLIVVQMGFGFGGKKTDNKTVLTSGYIGKRKSNGKEDGGTGKPGTHLGFLGYQHHFLVGASLLESIWLNLFTNDDLRALTVFPDGLGTPPWERMPQGEDCPIARTMKNSFMGRLLPISKFMLLAEDGIHYSDGIIHPSHKDGGFDPSIALDQSGKEVKALWADPERQFLRDLPYLLAFLAGKQGMNCFGLERCIKRTRGQHLDFGLWAGGVRVSSNAGEQYISGSNDIVEAILRLKSEDMGELWFIALENEMGELDRLSKLLYSAIRNYSKAQKVNDDTQAKVASNLFWQLCNQQAQALINACDSGTSKELRPMFAGFVHGVYNRICPHDTARQLEAWAENRPNTANYLKQ